MVFQALRLSAIGFGLVFAMLAVFFGLVKALLFLFPASRGGDYTGPNNEDK